MLKPKTSCIITNYNYADFVVDAVHSVLNQSDAFDEIIVVDEGSVEDSDQVLEQKFSDNPRVQYFSKKNGGMLSSFYEGFLKSSGDIVFFLDADDLFKNQYLEKALKMYGKTSCDFLFCAHEDFSELDKKVRQCYSQDVCLGYSILYALYNRDFYGLGSITSTVSVRRSVLEKLFPYPSLEDWVNQAENVLIYGSSLVGAKKSYLSSPLVRRRIHGDNKSLRRTIDLDKAGAASKRVHSYYHFVKLRKLKGFVLSEKMNYLPLGHEAEFKHEFLSIESPTYHVTKAYVRMILNAPALGWSAKLSQLRAVLKHYLKYVRAHRKEDLNKFIAYETGLTNPAEKNLGFVKGAK